MLGTADSKPVKRCKEAEVESRAEEDLVNASGHRQEVDRNFGLFNIIGLGLSSGNTWIALGGSIVTAIGNGGPPGVIYELIAASVFYWFIAASIAELASALPSSGGVHHWASVTAGPYGRVCGWFAGWWNFFAWIFGAASTTQIVAAQSVSMYALFHPGFEWQRWHVFVSYIIITWMCCLLVAFANRAMPTVEALGGTLVLLGFIITLVVCAVMPHRNNQPYASNSFVWRDWKNETGWSSNGLVFCLGMLNGAFAVGTADVISHLAEEVPRPAKNIPLGILAQYVIGFITALCFAAGIFYGIYDLDAVVKSADLFPLTEIYRQTTGSAGGSLGLLIVAMIPLFAAIIGCYLTSSRVFWTLARDHAAPCSHFFSRINRTQRNPFNSILLCGLFCTVLGCIYVGNSTAFSAFADSFVVLTSLSYLAAILPHLLTNRANLRPGWFRMKGYVGYVVNAISSLYIIVFVVLFCFPFAMPTDPQNMNYTCLITGGLSLFIVAFWFWRQGDYEGPVAPLG
ncbi:hypothetical protein MPDQ_004906 [Monascus purpureus]|uniref:Choline transporter n=1 Tax=Monascus purpureus TaxID=5098 RepID=A0A507QKJ7_MONPU|nr:hypothetical protein MPDQ_004906 [Monascus purpureus]